ncbi:50S ribosomal protein L11 methyltransferase [Novosphingobium sp.]|uniref:50S ribosomal protein L11 methyltransferase n=1 Tax=Novosphingobium sp. TaxID=1874826 RepID=UPI001DEA2E86|nr:50S ribosomal protein L11 methyltransferase [Novosphingobium sp.]MBX9663826.1 50S ribosomal protein L11 methyltransferase [Novosphingobium sp.]
MSWKITVRAAAEVVRAALVAHEDAEDWDFSIVLGGGQIDPADPDAWQLEAWLERMPTTEDKAAIATLFADGAPALIIEELADADWVTLSQHNVEPFTEGPFHVRTPDHPPVPGLRDFVIPASQAFGTGHHETTSGCLAMLAHIKAQGLVIRNLADIGTGTGLLAFAALHLWPRARATASDIDAVCGPVVAENAALNGVTLGDGPGKLAMVIAPGMAHPLLRAAAPYDLLIANILAGPLAELAPDFRKAVSPGGSVLLAGLLTTQEPTVRAAYTRAGFSLRARMQRGNWSILWLRRRTAR